MVEICAHSLETNLSKKKTKRARKARAKVETEEMENGEPQLLGCCQGESKICSGVVFTQAQHPETKQQPSPAKLLNRQTQKV